MEKVIVEFVILDKDSGPQPADDGQAKHIYLGAEISSYRVREALSQPYEVMLECIVPVPQAILNSIGQNCRFHIGRRTVERVLHGILLEACILESYAEDRAKVRLVMVPALKSMDLTHRSTVFYGISPAEAAIAVLDNHLTPLQRRIDSTHLRKSYAPQDVVVQCDESDLNFVSRIFAQYGIFYLFVHNEETETLVLLDSNEDCAVVGELASYPIDRHTSASTESIISFQHALSLPATPAAILQQRWLNPAAPLRHEVEQDEQAECGIGREIFLPAAYDRQLNHLDQQGEEQTIREGTERYRLLHAQEQQRQYSKTNGTSRVVALQAGARIEILDANASPSHNMSLVPWLITEVVHSGHQQPEMQVGREKNDVAAAYGNTFRCTPATIPFSVQEKPAQQQQRGGMITATVLGKWQEQASTEAEADSCGRVRIRFHWPEHPHSVRRRQTVGADANSAGCWARVGQLWGGMGYGANFTPRHGSEVIIGFADGVLEAPIVLGCLYNGKSTAPWQLDTHPLRNGLISQSSSPEAPESHKIILDDSAGEEHLGLQAYGSMRTKVRGFSTREVEHIDASGTLGATYQALGGASLHAEDIRQKTSLAHDLRTLSKAVTGTDPKDVLPEKDELQTLQEIHEQELRDNPSKNLFWEMGKKSIPSLKGVSLKVIDQKALDKEPDLSAPLKQAITLLDKEGLKWERLKLIARYSNRAKNTLSNLPTVLFKLISGNEDTLITGSKKMEVTNGVTLIAGLKGAPALPTEWARVRNVNKEIAKSKKTASLFVWTKGLRKVVEGNQHTTVSEKNRIDAKSIHLEATDKLVLKCGDSCITLTPKGIFINSKKTEILGKKINLVANKKMVLKGKKVAIN